MARKKQTIAQKVGAAVDAVLHPNEPKVEDNSPEAQKKRSEYQDHMAQFESKKELSRARPKNKDIEKHPKFDKFKSHLGVKHHDK